MARQAAERATEARWQREAAVTEARRAKTKKAQKEMMEELRRKQEVGGDRRFRAQGVGCRV